ncbi:MAG: recombination regulator RecX [Sulfuricella sp.]|nr:recombination regulator RecX [Sulfuricella sp.]
MADNAMPLREHALRFLARREYTRDELARKLAPLTEDEAEIAALLEDFQQRGWLSEQRFVEQTVHARQAKFGARRIAHELKEKGISAEAIEAALPQLRESELETARAVWQKKFGQPPEDARERARQMRFLMSRGFGTETIRRVMQGSTEEE